MTYVFQTCDLCDLHKHDDSGAFRVLPPIFHFYGAHNSFAGPVATVKCYEDNSLVKAVLDQPGQGRILVVDGAGSLRRALVGGNVAAAAARNGWAGIWVYGCVRDAAELKATSIGLAALALVPMPTHKNGQGQADVVVEIAGIRIAPGDWLYADEDGAVVSARPIHAPSTSVAQRVLHEFS